MGPAQDNHIIIVILVHKLKYEVAFETLNLLTTSVNANVNAITKAVIAYYASLVPELKAD